MSCDYDMFGLDKESSTLNDAKKAYYNLALLVHPDRNACINKDTAKLEMKVLTNMYKKDEQKKKKARFSRVSLPRHPRVSR